MLMSSVTSKALPFAAGHTVTNHTCIHFWEPPMLKLITSVKVSSAAVSLEPFLGLTQPLRIAALQNGVVSSLSVGALLIQIFYVTV